MRRAAKVDSNHGAVVSALRAAGASVLSLAAVGKGCPDLLVYFRGFYLLEVKDGAKPPSERKLTEDQEKFHKDWTGPITVVLGPEQALEAIGAKA